MYDVAGKLAVITGKPLLAGLEKFLRPRACCTI